MIKEEQIKKLNEEILFESRKMYGMYGNIQWAVEDIIDNTLVVWISSPIKDLKKEDKQRIAENIKKSIRSRVPNMEVKVNWRKWKPSDGFGFLIDVKKFLKSRRNENEKQTF
jgi:hypothetical protein